MSTTSAQRVTAGLAIGAAAVALVGNGLSPRLNGDDVDVYRKIATSDRWAVASVIVLAALLLVTAAFFGLSRLASQRGESQLGDYARLAAGVGGSVAIMQGALQLYGYRQQARAFAGANPHNVVSAFWATNALDHASAALFAVATVILLGIAPILLGAEQLRSRISGRLGLVAAAGGAVCVIVGAGELLKADQSTFDIPFAIGSVLVTLWLLATGVIMWRNTAPSRSATVEL